MRNLKKRWHEAFGHPVDGAVTEKTVAFGMPIAGTEQDIPYFAKKNVIGSVGCHCGVIWFFFEGGRCA